MLPTGTANSTFQTTAELFLWFLRRVFGIEVSLRDVLVLAWKKCFAEGGRRERILQIQTLAF